MELQRPKAPEQPPEDNKKVENQKIEMDAMQKQI